MLKTSLRIFRFILLLAAAASTPLSSSAQLSAPAPAAPAATPAPGATPAATPSPVVPPAEIAPQAQNALSTLRTTEAEPGEDPEVVGVRQGVPDLAIRLGQLTMQSGKVTEGGAALEALRQLQTGWERLQTDLRAAVTALSQRGQVLQKKLEQIQQIEVPWLATQQKQSAPGGEQLPPETLALVQEVLRESRAARQRVQQRQSAVLELQARLGELTERARAGAAVVQQASAAAVKTLLVRDSAPLWEPEARPRPDLRERWRTSLEEQWVEIQLFASNRVEVFVVHGIIFFALLLGLFWLRRHLRTWTSEQPRLQKAVPIVDVPVATALSFSFLLLVESPLYVAAPSLFRGVAAFVLMPFLVVLLRRLLNATLRRPLYVLADFVLIDQVRKLLHDMPTLGRWIYFVELLLALYTALLLARPSSVEKLGRHGRWIAYGARLAVALLGVAISAQVFGYARLAALLGQAVLGSAYWALFIYALLRVLSGLALITFCLGPLSRTRAVQHHRDLLLDRVYAVLQWLAFGFWLWKTTLLLQISGPISRAAVAIFTHPLGYGAFSITLGSIVSFVLAIWLALKLSRFVRFILEEEAFPHLRLAPGLPYAISTMVNYGILFVGFLIALALLGIDLTKVTIVAGAFSVGLGFGLQNVINNFVSGIIILFERPVKVGDTIQLGDAVGEVQRIGIRASIVRTREGSEIIVPNGNLIANPVTNWTYSNRGRAVELPVTVAPGHDPRDVMKLLERAAASLPETEERPAPQVFLQSVTAAGLSFVVKVWTGRYESWVQVRSDVALAIDRALQEAEIKIA